MMRLAELQAQFESFLLDGNRGIENLTVGSERLPAAERLAVYGNAYRLRLLEVLADDFPGLKGLVGDEAFERLATAYINARPSGHPSVRWFGRHLESFLRDMAPYRHQPYFAEMAAFEWTQGEVMDAANSDAVTENELAGLAPDTWPTMTIVFQPALRRLDLAWNIPAVWQAIREEETPPDPERAPRPVSWLFWRVNMEVHWRSLDDDEAYAIDAARGGATFGATFGAICEGLLARTHDDQVPLRAAGFLKRWTIDELVARIVA